MGPWRAETGDILGIEERVVIAEELRRLTVYPRVVPLERLGLSTRSALVTLPSKSALFEDTSRIMGVRDYQAGDSPRRIHWTATARTGRLVVKQYQPAVDRETLICLDMNARSYPVQWHLSTEQAIVVAASLAHHMVMREGLSVGLSTEARDPLAEGQRCITLPPRVGRAQLMSVLGVLARIQTASTRKFAELLREESAGLAWGSTIVVITGRIDDDLAATSLYLKRSGHAVAMILVQQAHPWAREGRGEVAGIPVYRVWTDRDLVSLLVLLQLCGDIADGQAPLQAGVPHIDAKTLGFFCLVFVCWLVATATTRDLDRAGEPPDRTFGYVAPTQRVVRRFFWGGVVLFAVAGLTQASIDRALKLPVPAQSGPLLNVLLYFALGILLVAQVRYAALRRRWHDQEIPIAVGLANRWLRCSLAFVGLAMLAALLLPTSRTLGLVELGRALWGPFSTAAAQIVTAIARFLMRFGLPYRPHAPVQHIVPPSLPPLKHLPPAASVHRKVGHSHGSNWSSYVQLLLFWSAVLAGAVYLVHSCLRGHARGLRVTVTLTSVLGVLGRAWRALWDWFSFHARVAADLVPRRLDLRKRSASPPGGLLPFDSLGALSVRRQVQRYYLNMVRRAAERGVSRRPSQTPHEFIHALAPRIPDAESDVHFLTGEFVDARYSAHPVEAPQVQRARESWHRLRAALRPRSVRKPE